MVEKAKEIEERVESASNAIGKAPWFWIRNSDGKKSASLTLAVVAFIVTTVWLVLGIVSEVAGVPITPFSSTVAMAYLTPILALYWGRRNTRAKNGHGE